jgi:putative oxidoreductase
MRKIISTQPNPYFLDLSLLIVRVLIALTMLTHGTPKLMKFTENSPLSFEDPLNIGVVPSLLLAVFAEFICSIFILIGLFTRVAVVPLMVTMLIAAFVVHKADGFAEQEKALIYLMVYFFLFVMGSGKYSIDRLIEKR